MPARAPLIFGPLIFGIGLPHSGGRVLEALFAANGKTWRHHQGGKLAQSIAYAHAAGTLPLTQWPNAIGFSGLYRMHKRHLPDLRVQDMVAVLLAQFPNAYFINTHRDPADWIAARFGADNGDHRTAAAWHAKTIEADLPADWMAEHAAYQQFCEDTFKDNARFINFNTSSEPVDKIIDFISTDIHLNRPDVLPEMTISAKDIKAVVDYIAQIPNPTAPTETDTSFVQQVSDFCQENVKHLGQSKALSRSAVTWTQSRHLTDRLGGPVNMIQQQPDGPYLLNPDSGGFERAQGTLNELIAHGAQPPLHIDMMDARFIGSKGRRTPPRRTVAYNRRTGAKNLTLWPLPGYHSLAPTGHAGGFPRDEISFVDKADRCVWLGNMTGRMSPVLAPEGRRLRGVYALRDRAETLAHDSPEWDDVIADFNCVARYNLVKTYRDHPDFEVGLVLRARWKRLSETRAFAGLCSPKRDRTWFHQFRYILSLAGNDTGSNFLLAASSNALILKEEDGWELFYTDAFKPWVHYVPLEEGALDVEEKLAWARANPDKAEAMSMAATELYDRFANPNNRAAILRAITAGLNASR